MLFAQNFFRRERNLRVQKTTHFQNFTVCLLVSPHHSKIEKESHLFKNGAKVLQPLYFNVKSGQHQCLFYSLLNFSLTWLIFNRFLSKKKKQ